MQDIDFDEIDRAVNSITSAHTEAQVRTAPVVDTQPIVRETVAAAPAPTPVVASPAVRRSSGRFMDVVHPSSDMRPGLSARPAAPSAPSLHREEIVERHEDSIGRSEPTAVSSSAFHWPDPVSEVPVASVPVPTPEEVPPQVDEEDDAVSLESPFLTDAKVAKRPLGAFSEVETSPSVFESSAPSPEEQLLEQPSALQPTEQTSEQPPELPVVPEDDLDLAVSTTVAEETPAVQVAETTLTGPTSIIQQYKEQPRVEGEPSGAIFDTEAYHQPLAHATKKRSGILVAVWVIALILVGGGIGAGVYFVVLPLLG